MLVAASLAAAPGAGALEPGVHVDPGSPAGKEYAFPLDRARRDAGGSSRVHGRGHSKPGSRQSDSTTPGLFGQGITPGGPRGPGGGTAGASPASAHATTGNSGQPGSRGHAATGSSRTARGASTAPGSSSGQQGGAAAREPALSDIRAAAETGDGSLLTSPVGLAVVLLAVGGGLGLAARRLGGRGRTA